MKHYVEYRDGNIMNELERVCKVAILAYFEVSKTWMFLQNVGKLHGITS
jgi:hypothetical protein